MLEICEILLIFVTLGGVGAAFYARASVAAIAGSGVVALEGCVRWNGFWHDAVTDAWQLAWNWARRPPPLRTEEFYFVDRAPNPALVSLAEACPVFSSWRL